MSEHHDDETLPIAIPLEQLRELAGAVANELRSAPAPLPGNLRERFITVRSALFQRGIYDPVLVRFDSATAPRASTEEIAAELELVAGAL